MAFYVYLRVVTTNLWGTRDLFHGAWFSMDQGAAWFCALPGSHAWVDGALLACVAHYWQAADWCQSIAQELGTPALGD